jgi:pimeloyl-ACP methyl ester carboxylesterase
VQFSDPELRKYNLVAVDSRGHGESTSTPIPTTFGPEQAAEDVALFIDALELPPCHIVGLGMGSCIGLHVAHMYPDKVLSLFAISPLPEQDVSRFLPFIDQTDCHYLVSRRRAGKVSYLLSEFLHWIYL